MGIPVVLLTDNEQENERRFSSLNGILHFYTFNELRDHLVNFDPPVVEIESLKEAIRENLKLSIKRELNEFVSVGEFRDVRDFITYYNAKEK